MANNQPLSPQGYNILRDPTNTNPFWEDDPTPPVDHGIPAGGTTGQVLTKDSDADYDASWQDAQGGGGGVTPEEVQQIVDTTVDPVISRVSDLETASQELVINVTNITNRVRDLESDLTDEMAARIFADADLQEQINNINQQGYDDTEVRQLIQENKTTIENVDDDLQAYKDTTDAAITEIASDLTQVENSVTSLGNRVTAAEESVDTVQTDLQALEATVANNKEDSDTEFTAVNGRIDTVEENLQNEITARTNAVAGVQGNLDSAVASLGGRLTIVEARADEAYEYGYEFIQWKPTVDAKLTEIDGEITEINTRTIDLVGGTNNQVLAKDGGDDYSYKWVDPQIPGSRREVLQLTPEPGSYEGPATYISDTVSGLPTSWTGPTFIVPIESLSATELKEWDYVEITGKVRIRANPSDTIWRPNSGERYGYGFSCIAPIYTWPDSPGGYYEENSVSTTLLDGTTIYFSFGLPGSMFVTLISSVFDPGAIRFYNVDNVQARVVRYE